MVRKAIPQKVRLDVLTEAGFRCAIPTCRNILALDLHHIEPVSEGGPNEAANLIALCAYCHALFTRGEIPRESIHAWKTMLVGLGHAFDQEAIDNLLFVSKTQGRKVPLLLSPDGVLKFSRLIGADLVAFEHAQGQEGSVQRVGYRVSLTPKGERIIEAWFSGSRDQVRAALAWPIDDT